MPTPIYLMHVNRMTMSNRKGCEVLRKKCYIYTRVSTVVQTEGYSLEAQTERLRKYADYKDMEVVREYCDAGKSGMSINGRPAFMEMLDDISSEKDEISCVLVFKLSRFGRNAADILKSLQLLMDYDVDLICVEDAIDSSTQGGRLTLAILSAVAEMEHENITVQFMAARMQKLMNGGWPGGGVPYGYVSLNKELVVVPEAADLVRLIYQKYLEPDMKLNTVVGWLNDNGYKRVVRGEDKVITSDFVTSVLGNPIYYGMIVYNRRTNSEEIKRNPKEIISVRGKHEAIIPEDVWMQVQEKRKRLRMPQRKVDNPERISLLSGLVKCPVCGNGMITKKSKSRNNNHGGYYKIMYSYGCRNYRKSAGRVCNCRRTYNQEKLDGAVLEIVGKVTETREFRQAVMNVMGDRSSLDACEEELKKARKELHSQEHLKYKLGMELDNLDIFTEDYNGKYENIQSEIDGAYDQIECLEEKIRKLKRRRDALQKGVHTSDNIRKILDNFALLFDRMNCEERRELCRQFIERIEVFPEEREDGRILKQIEFRFPVYYEAEGKREENNEPDEIVTFSVDCAEHQVTASEAKATYAEIRAYVKGKYGLNIPSLYIAQMKRKYGLDIGKAYNKPAKNKNHVPKCPLEKEMAIMDALKHFRMLDEDVEYRKESAV